MKKSEILFLKQEEVIAAGLLDMKQAIEVAEFTFKLLGEGKIIQPNKIFLGVPDNENWESYGMSNPHISAAKTLLSVSNGLQNMFTTPLSPTCLTVWIWYC